MYIKEFYKLLVIISYKKGILVILGDIRFLMKNYVFLLRDKF